jgi:hypothetical protein
MRKNLSILFFAFIYFSAGTIAQENLKNNLQLYFARSFHGTGDLRGINFTAEYGHLLSRRLDISGNITSTMHWGSFELIVNSPSGSFDGSFRYVTAGLQAGSKLGYSFLNLPHHLLRIQGGAFIRFQSSSLPDQYGVTFPPAINYPEPVFTFRHEEKQNIFTLGYVAELSYSYITEKNLLLGAKAGFQNDTNADVISYYGIFIGKKLKGAK